jgi:RHS repeat-associated protein
VVREIRADTVTNTDYTYDALGRLATVTDPKQQVTTYTYNLDGSVASLAHTNAEVSTPGVTWTYDPAYARVTTMVDGTGTTSYTYHQVGQLGAGQVATVDGPLANDVISYSYDQLGRMISRAIDGVPLTLTYDPLGRVEREANALGTFTYTFDGVSGRLATVTYPNNQTSTYTYYPAAQDHRLQTIDHRYPNGAPLSKFDYTYDIVGNILTWRQQADTAAVIWDYGYDNADQLIRAVKRATDPQATVLQRFAYGYDPAGNRLYEQIDDTVTSWTYDRLNRLMTQQAGGLLRVAGSVNEPATVRVQGQAAAVNATGAFSGGVQVAPGTTRFTITARDASGNSTTENYDVDQTGSSKMFAFDANGNVGADGALTFEWDARDRMVAINRGAHRTEFQYDGRSRRATRVEKESGLIVSGIAYVWSDTTLVEERALGTNAVSRRLESAGVEQGVPFFYAKDHLGSPHELVDGFGVVRGRYTYDPFGRRSQVAGDATSPVGFTGHDYHSDTGLILTLFRAYSTEYGRWLSRDPLGTLGSPNLYAYVENKPIRLVDPFGLASVQTTHCDNNQRSRIENAFGGICGSVAQPSGRCRQVLSQNNLLDGMQRQCREGIRVECTSEFTCGEYRPPFFSRGPGLIRLSNMAVDGAGRCGGDPDRHMDGPAQTLAHEMAHAAGVGVDMDRTYPPHERNWRLAEDVAYACRQPQ